MLTNAMPLSLFVTLTLIARTLWVHTVVRAKPDSWVMEKLVEVKRHVNSYRLQCNASPCGKEREEEGHGICYFWLLDHRLLTMCTSSSRW